MKKKVKDTIVDLIILGCLGAMFVFAHGYKLWCTAMAIFFGILALVLQFRVKTPEEEGDEYNF